MKISCRCVGSNICVFNFPLWNRLVPPGPFIIKVTPLRKDGQHLAVPESDTRPASLCWAWDRPLLPNGLLIFLLEGSHLLKEHQKPGVQDTGNSKQYSSTILSAFPGLKCAFLRLKFKSYQFLEESTDVKSSATGN